MKLNDLYIYRHHPYASAQGGLSALTTVSARTTTTTASNPNPDPNPIVTIIINTTANNNSPLILLCCIDTPPSCLTEPAGAGVFQRRVWAVRDARLHGNPHAQRRAGADRDVRRQRNR